MQLHPARTGSEPVANIHWLSVRISYWEMVTLCIWSTFISHLDNQHSSSFPSSQWTYLLTTLLSSKDVSNHFQILRVRRDGSMNHRVIFKSQVFKSGPDARWLKWDTNNIPRMQTDEIFLLFSKFVALLFSLNHNFSSKSKVTNNEITAVQKYFPNRRSGIFTDIIGIK